MPLLAALIFSLQTASPPSCRDVADCRAQAEAAAARSDFETFHDLAWRAVQKGRPNDPELMYLLARAQARSGRYDDAIVMLGRIADLGVTTDAATSEDFARVRLLPKWHDLEPRLTGASSASAPEVVTPSPSAVAAAPAAPGARTTASSAPPSAGSPEATVSFDASTFSPFGLAHDSVSRRFLVGDRAGARLLVVDDVSHHVVNYASAASAGFYDTLTGFAIDARRGDLWVASAKGEGDEASSMLHKLQLVSGRTLMRVPLAGNGGSARLVGVAVTPDGTVYAVDAIDSRLFRLRPGARRLEQVMRLDARDPTALAAADDHLVYIAAAEGLVRVDVAARTAERVKSVEKLTNFESLAWRSGALVGIERVADSFLVVRIPLDASGTRAQPRAILAASAQPTVGTLAPEGFYYLAERGSIRLLKIK